MKGAVNAEWLGKTINMVKDKTRLDWQLLSILMHILMTPFSRLYPACHYGWQYHCSEEHIVTSHDLQYTEGLNVDVTKFSSQNMLGGAWPCFTLSTVHSAYDSNQDGSALKRVYCHECTVYLKRQVGLSVEIKIINISNERQAGVKGTLQAWLGLFALACMQLFLSMLDIV